MVNKLIKKGYRPLEEKDWAEIAEAAQKGEWNIRKVFHCCNADGYEAVDGRGRVHGTDCCGTTAVLRHHKNVAERVKNGPLVLK